MAPFGEHSIVSSVSGVCTHSPLAQALSVQGLPSSQSGFSPSGRGSEVQLPVASQLPPLLQTPAKQPVPGFGQRAPLQTPPWQVRGPAPSKQRESGSKHPSPSALV